jgi:hypothetical protein
MASIDDTINVYLYSSGTNSLKATISNVSGTRNGYYGQTIAAVAESANKVYLNDARTQRAIGYELYVNDETNSYQTGDIVTFNGISYTVGPIKKPTLDVKTARFFNTTSIAGSPISGVTKSGNRKATTFDISINLT